MQVSETALEQLLCDPRSRVTREDCEAVIENLIAPNKLPHDYKWFRQSNEPRPRLAGVYGLFLRDQLQYIGRSENFCGRITEHRTYRSAWFDSVGLLPLPSNCIALAEFRLIRNLKPPHNKSHVKERATWGPVKVDEIAEILNTTPGAIFDLCADAGIQHDGLNLDAKEIVRLYARRADARDTE